MAITFVGQGGGYGINGFNITPSLPAGCQANDLLLIACGQNGIDELSCSGYAKKAAYSIGGDAAGMDLVVTLEMLGATARSETSGQIAFDRSKIHLDPADYDGATYFFEIVATTTAAGVNEDVELYDLTNDTVEATINTGGSAVSYVRMRSAAFTPTAGDAVYQVRLPQTTAQSDVLVFTARIVVVQSGATKTRLQIPLAAGHYSAQYDATHGEADGTSSTSYAQATPGRFNLWKKEAAKLATIAAGTPWSLEACLSTANAGATASLGLFNASEDAAVAGAEVTRTGATNVDLCTVADFADGASNFTDLDEFEVRVKTSNASYSARVYTANLYVRLTSLTKAQVHTRIGRAYSGTGGDNIAHQRITHDEAQWSTGTTWYFEATASDASASPVASIGVRADTDDVGTGTTTLGTTLTMGAVRSRGRSTAIDMTDEYRYMGRVIASSGTVSMSSEFLIAELETAGATTGATQATLFWKRHTGTESAPTITGASDALGAICFAFRGVVATGDPWDAFDAGLKTGVDVDVTFPSLTTATDGAMAVLLGATAANNSYSLSYVGYGNLSAPRGMSAAKTTAANDAAHVFLYGVQAAHGSIGAPYATKQSLTDQLWVSMAGALKPAPSAGTFDLVIDCMVADEAAADWTQPVISGYGSDGSEAGDHLSVSGTGFGTDGMLTFGDTPAVITSWTETVVQVVIPAVADGSYTVTLAPYGDYYTASFTFVVEAGQVLPAPAITSTAPTSGVVGSTVTLTGTDFGSAGVVTIGTTTMTQQSYSDTLIRVTVPDKALGLYPIIVTPTGRTPSPAVNFSIVEAPPETDPVETNPLFDGTLKVEVARAALPRMYRDFSPVLLPGLHYGSTNPGGFGDAGFSIEATDPAGPLVYLGHTMAKGDLLRIRHGAAPVTLYEGEITGDVSHAIIEGGDAYYEVTGGGLWWKAGRRGDFCRTWSDPDTERWFEKATGGPWQIDTEGKVELRLEAGQSLKGAGLRSLYYWLDDGLGDPEDFIHGLIGMSAGRTLDMSNPTVNWHADLQTSDSPWGTWTTVKSWAHLAEWTSQAFYIPVSTTTKALRLRLQADQAVSGMTEDRYISLSKIAVLTSNVVHYHRDQINTIDSATGTITMLQSLGPLRIQPGDRVFITGASAAYDGWRTVTWGDGVAFRVGVGGAGTGSGYVFTAPYVDEAMGRIAETTGLAAGSSWDDDSSGPSNWGLDVRPHASRADAIEYCASTHPSRLTYGFWDDAVFHCYQNPYSTSRVYLIDSSDPAIDAAVFRSSEETPTHVKVLYSFRDVDGGDSVYPDGTVRAVYRPEEPDWDDASVVLDVWDEWSDLLLETGQAEAIGDQILAWIGDNAYQGTYRISAPTVIDTSVVPQAERLTAYIRAGDFIVDLNLDAALVMITSMTMDVDTGTAELGIGETRNEFVARIKARKRDTGRGWHLPRERPARRYR